MSTNDNKNSNSGQLPTLWKMLYAHQINAEDEDVISDHWTAIMNRLQTHAEEARWCGNIDAHARGIVSFMHKALAFFNPPLEVVGKVIEIFPECLQMRGLGGTLPLHYVASLDGNHSVDVVKLILEHYPQAAFAKDNSGDTPLRWALTLTALAPAERSPQHMMYSDLLSHRNLKVIRALLKANPHAALQSTNHVSGGGDPWKIVCKLWRCGRVNESLIGNLCELTEIMLRARYLARSLMHSSCCDDSARNMDITAVRSMNEASLLASFRPLHAIVQEEHQVLANPKCRTYFLDRYGEQAAHHDANGRLCLHLAIENGYTWNTAVKDLYEAARQAMETRDLNTRLYPFMSAAVVEENSDTGTVFELLRADPSSLTTMIQPLLKEYVDYAAPIN
mmetsp:Transcript_6202/g.9043  ORF Transcript_6202/g.9043 Transcript_6202/m.9043 type:complete len:392 (-) Transcript_6202:1667-2842(-)|eukprot:CAMPEP_0196814464 /NCGR_PEP_ID=MMETSP1362-20130617/43395_1 /TAXON_ID=163516 /ORGANISM="Leptocylindrus danicus, Strain CCMP1856" /LENGTH=391 /DNA_ID=CAMNT_0042191077 /DNA_START=104 /DNA_END=1279 /DNA_ORIENTATION=-